MYCILYNTECVDGRYGKDCENVGGKCKDNGICDKATGVCPAGCEVGWMISLCDQSNHKPFFKLPKH